MQIVNCEHDNPTVGLQLIEQIQQRCPNSHRVCRWPPRRPRLQLVDNPVREEHLVLIAASPEKDNVRKGSEEPSEKRRLSRAGLAL